MDLFLQLENDLTSINTTITTVGDEISTELQTNLRGYQGQITTAATNIQNNLSFLNQEIITVKWLVIANLVISCFALAIIIINTIKHRH